MSSASTNQSKRERFERLRFAACLCASAGFSFAAIAAAPVEESTGRQYDRTVQESRRYDDPAPPAYDGAPAAPAAQSDAGSGSGRLTDLFYQIQLLQDEVSSLRGLVEEQEFRIERMSREQSARYADMDRRILELSSGSVRAAPPPVAANNVDSGSEIGRFQAAIEEVRAKNWDVAVQSLEALIADFPNGQRTGHAFFWMGEVFLVTGDLERARQNYVQVVTLFPDHAKTPDALRKLGMTYHQLGDRARALEYLERVVREYPSHTAASLARSYIDDEVR